MVAYLLFPLSNLIGMNVYITKSIIQKVWTVFIVSPKEGGLVFFPKLLIVMGMVSAFHPVRFKFFYTILKCTGLLFYTTLPDITIKVTYCQGWQLIKVWTVFMQGFKQ